MRKKITEEKRSKTTDNRSQSKQNANRSSATGSSSSRPVHPSNESSENQTGTKRSSSKVESDKEDQDDDEPETKRVREEEGTSMNDVQHIEVNEFYSVPRIAPRRIGKYVSKCRSFDINVSDDAGEPWDFMNA